jgi:hypothetical protein
MGDLRRVPSGIAAEGSRVGRTGIVGGGPAHLRSAVSRDWRSAPTPPYPAKPPTLAITRSARPPFTERSGRMRRRSG